MDDVVGLARDHAWLEISALVVGLLVRLLKGDVLGPVVPPRWRPALAWFLGLVAAALQMVVGGATVPEAVTTAILAPVLAMAGHATFVDWLRGGRDFPVPSRLAARKPPSVPPTPVALVLLAFLLSGCGAQLESQRGARIAAAKVSTAAPGSTRDAARCASLDDQQRLWGGVGKGAAFGAGAAGVSTIPVEDNGARIAIAATSVGLGVIATTALFIADGASASWARECSE